ncbi:MAG: MJ0042-type zinc finger domain-containing protein [Blastopirellula sp. JB062]
MPILFSCTTCGAKFRVSDTMAGKKVRCPKCQSVEQVPVDDEPVGDSIQGKEDDFWNQTAGTASSSSSKLDGLLQGDFSDLSASSGSVARRPDEPRSITSREARDRVFLPGTVLLVFSVLVTVLNAVGIVITILRIMIAPPPGMNGNMMLTMIVVAAATILLTTSTLKGVNSFRNVDEIGWAWTGLILAMTPLGTAFCCVITLPFAIWGIVLLCDRRISEHFRS